MFSQPARGELVDDVLHVAGGHELPLLDVDRPARLRGGHEQIGLPGEKRRDLQHVADLAGRRGLVRFVDVGRHGQAGLLLHLVQNWPSPPPTRRRESASTLVRLALSNEALKTSCIGNSRGDLPQALGDRKRQLFGFDDARPGDHQQRLAAPQR